MKNVSKRLPARRLAIWRPRGCTSFPRAHSACACDSQCRPGHVPCGLLDVMRRSGWSIGFHSFPELLHVGTGYKLFEDPCAVFVMVLSELYQ